MSNDLTCDNETPIHDERKGREQFPVDVKVVKAVRFDTNCDRSDLLRLVVMNDRATSRYSAYREYHCGNASVSLDDVSSFTMRSSTIEGTQQAIDEFLGSMSVPVEVPQIVSFCRGIQCPSSARKRLYKAIDPDDSTKMMGVLIEQDAEGRLGQITWYKTWEASAAFYSTPDTMEFELVKDESGAPSLDPCHIGGWTWHYSTSFGIGLSSQAVTE